MLIFAFITSVAALLIILSPFFLGSGGTLQAASSINSPNKLEAIKKSILLRYIEDERAFDEKRLTRLAWEQRKQFLTNRYIDSSRRLDYIRSLIAEQADKGKGAS
jgi:hypothetical protein